MYYIGQSISAEISGKTPTIARQREKPAAKRSHIIEQIRLQLETLLAGHTHIELLDGARTVGAHRLTRQMGEFHIGESDIGRRSAAIIIIIRQHHFVGLEILMACSVMDEEEKGFGRVLIMILSD